jgi:hypothetical protein
MDNAITTDIHEWVLAVVCWFAVLLCGNVIAYGYNFFCMILINLTENEYNQGYIISDFLETASCEPINVYSMGLAANL